MNYSLLVFDLDGTLVDSSVDIGNAINAMLMHFNLEPLALADVVNAIGDGVTTLIKRCLASAGAVELGVSEAKPVFVQYYIERLTENTRPYNGVIETLQALDAVPKAIVTNKMEDLALVLLQTLDMEQYFKMVVGGDTLSERKPSALPLRHVCNTLGVAPGSALMIGDSVNDIVTAKCAGADSCAMLYGYQLEERLRKEQANYYLLSFRDLLAL